MKRKMIIVYKMGNSYVVKTCKGFVAGLSSCTEGMDKMQAKTFTRKLSTAIELCVEQMRRVKDEQSRN